MTFAKHYEPEEFEADIYAAWEASGIFNPTIPTIPIDNDDDGKDGLCRKCFLSTRSCDSASRS